MKIVSSQPFVETSGILEEKFFSISDTGMIFDILRNKMYSDPISAICREITCNARDAHREVNKSNEPIVIQIPSIIDPNIKIKDFGPGISKERMYDIFIKYTASTKRNDNLQTGGFGLGAKTPFSYSDTFTITTVNDGIKYSYAAFIDESKVGKMMLLHSEPTTDCNGTEIVIPVKPQDFSAFKEALKFVTKHWEIIPIFTGDKIELTKILKKISSDDWFISPTINYNSKAIKVIVDGIEYPCPQDKLSGIGANLELFNSLNSDSLYLEFKVGELSLSANREQLSFDKNTENKLKEKLKKCEKEFFKILQDKINSFPTYWDAMVYVNNEMNSIFYWNSTNMSKKLSLITWNDKPITIGTIKVEHEDIGLMNISFFTKNSSYSRKYKSNADRIYKSNTNQIPFEKDIEIFINDVPDLEVVDVKHVKSFFVENPTIKRIYLITPKKDFDVEKMKVKYNLDTIECQNLSDIFAGNAKARKFSQQKLIVYKFDKAVGTWKHVPYDTYSLDKNKKALFYISNNTTYNTKTFFTNKDGTSPHKSGLMQSMPNDTSFYAVDINTSEARIKKDFATAFNFNDIFQNFIKSISIDLEKMHFLHEQYGSIRFNSEVYMKIIGKIKAPNSDFETLTKEIISIQKEYESNKDNFNLCIQSGIFSKEFEKFNTSTYEKANPEFSINYKIKNIHKKYPMIALFEERHYYGIPTEQIKILADYIDLIENNK